MQEHPSAADLRDPDLKVVGFQLWVHEREFPDAQDYDDGNWLLVTACCVASGASVWVHGAILTVGDIEGFGRECDELHRGELKSASLSPWEPNLKVSIELADEVGHLRAIVEITPQHLEQQHRFEFEIDQSFLPEIVQQCSAIVRKFPCRGL